jgi:hypothetical protein
MGAKLGKEMGGGAGRGGNRLTAKIFDQQTFDQMTVPF